LEYGKGLASQPVNEINLEVEEEKTKNIERISHYRIVSQIGAGGMGEVYLAKDTWLNRLVALKILHKTVASNNDRLLRFEREARAVSALNHPNILTIFEFGTDSGIHFLASEFVKGETLRDRLNRARLTILEILDISVQIASALKAAHETGVVVQPDTMFPDTAPWVLFSVWAGYQISENTVGEMQSAYESSYTLTRDEAPDLK
jgi:serine/threonine protein kinase